MRLRVMAGVMVLALACSWSWGASSARRGGKRTTAKPKRAPAKQMGPVKLLVNGQPAQGAVLIDKGLPLVSLQVVATAVSAARPGVTIEKTAAGEATLSRPEALVRIRAGAKQMSVDGQPVPLMVPAKLTGGDLYVSAEVLGALYPDYKVSLTYQAPMRTVALTYELTPEAAAAQAKAAALAAPPPPAVPPAPPVTPRTPPVTPAASGPTNCAPSGPSRGVATQEFGKPGAKVEIIALLPITHGCHVRTEAEVKKAYEQHPNEVHAIIADLFGSDAPAYLPKVGGGTRAVVSINGKTSFEVNGRRVMLERQENGAYRPDDIGPAVEQELAAK